MNRSCSTGRFFTATVLLPKRQHQYRHGMQHRASQEVSWRNSCCSRPGCASEHSGVGTVTVVHPIRCGTPRWIRLCSSCRTPLLERCGQLTTQSWPRFGGRGHQGATTRTQCLSRCCFQGVCQRLWEHSAVQAAAVVVPVRMVITLRLEAVTFDRKWTCQCSSSPVQYLGGRDGNLRRLFQCPCPSRQFTRSHMCLLLLPLNSGCLPGIPREKLTVTFHLKHMFNSSNLHGNIHRLRVVHRRKRGLHCKRQSTLCAS